jgi:hypothetical protein
MQNSGRKMPLEKFVSVVEKICDEGYKQIGLFSWTEPFINRDLHEYVSTVKRYGLRCMVSSNFSLRRIPGLEATLKSGLDHLIVSVSGFDQQVYQVNHVDGNISYVKDNLRQAAALKANGLTSARIVLRFIKFPYNHGEEEKLEKFSRELDIEFEVIAGVGDPTALPTIASNKTYEATLGSFRSERPYDLPGKVCPLISGKGTSIDSDGAAYLCCAYPNYDALRIGSYLDLPQEAILLRKYNHPFCGSCSFPRQDATPADHQALVEALHFRFGVRPDTPTAAPQQPQPDLAGGSVAAAAASATASHSR